MMAYSSELEAAGSLGYIVRPCKLDLLLPYGGFFPFFETGIPFLAQNDLEFTTPCLFGVLQL